MRLQMEKERIFEQGAISTGREKVLIVCERGTAGTGKGDGRQTDC